METIDGIAFFAIVETSIVPVEVELEDVAAAYKRLQGARGGARGGGGGGGGGRAAGGGGDCLEGTAGNTAEQNCA